MATVTREPTPKAASATSASEPTAPEPVPTDLPARADRLFRITSVLYHAMAEHGLFKKEDRVVLLDGFLVKKMTKGPKHILAVQNVVDLLAGLGLQGFYPRKEDPVALYDGPGGTDSEPEPDVVLTRGTKHTYADHLPKPNDVVLAIEVADTSLRVDRAGLDRYAWFGIPCVWIVNLVNGTIEVYDTPMDSRTPEARYGHSEVRRAGEAVEIVADGRVLGRVAVSDIIP
jgi:hypothetical protein